MEAAHKVSFVEIYANSLIVIGFVGIAVCIGLGIHWALAIGLSIGTLVRACFIHSQIKVRDCLESLGVEESGSSCALLFQIVCYLSFLVCLFGVYGFIAYVGNFPAAVAFLMGAWCCLGEAKFWALVDTNTCIAYALRGCKVKGSPRKTEDDGE